MGKPREEGDLKTNNFNQSLSHEGEFAISKLEIKDDSFLEVWKGILLGLISMWIWLLGIILWKYCYLFHSHTAGFDYAIFTSDALTYSIVGLAEAAYLKVNILHIPKNEMMPVAIRLLTGMVGMPSFFIAVKYIPMSQASIIISVSPLLISVMAYFLRSEVLHKRTVAALIGSFIGVVLINVTKASNSQLGINEDKLLIGLLLSFVSLGFHVTSGVSNKFLVRFIHSEYSPFYMALGMFLWALSIFIFARMKLDVDDYDFSAILLFSSCWVWTYISQSLNCFASQYEKAAISIPLTYLTPVLLLLIDWFFFHYEFTTLYYIGFSIIIVSVMTPAVYNLMYPKNTMDRIFYSL